MVYQVDINLIIVFILKKLLISNFMIEFYRVIIFY